MFNPNLSTKLDEWCPSSPVYEDGKQIGWFYAIHIRPDGDKRTECQFCKLQFNSLGGDNGS